VNIFQFLMLNLIFSFFIYLKQVFFYKVFLFYLRNLINNIILLVFNFNKEDLFFIISYNIIYNWEALLYLAVRIL